MEMNKRIISFLLALAMMFSLTGLCAYAEEEPNVVVYQQTFENLLDSKGNGLTDFKIKERDTTFTAIGTNAACAAKTAVVNSVQETARTIENFDTISSLGGNKVFSLTNNANAQISIEDKMLKLVKTEAGSGKTVVVATELGGYVRTLPSYAVELDLKAAFTDNNGLTLQFTIGADFAFRQVKDQGNKCTFEWYDSAGSGGWDKSDQTLYDLSELQHLTFVVNADKTVDAYIGSGTEKKLLKSGMPQRGTNSFTALKYTVGASLKATTYLDNFTFTPILPEQNAVEPDSFEYPILRVEKLAKAASSASKMNLAPYLCGAKEYTYSFDLQLDAAPGFSVSIATGAFIQLGVADGGFEVKDHVNGSLAVTPLGKYPFDQPTNIAFRVHAGQGTADLYIGGQLVKAGIPARAGYQFDEWNFILNNSSLGAAYLDNFTLTLHDVGAVTTTATQDTTQIDFENFTPGVFQNGTGGFTADNTPAVGLISVADAPEDAEGTALAHGKALRMYSPIMGDSSHPAVYNLSRNYAHLLTDAVEYTTSFDLLLTGTQSYNIAERSSGSGGFKLNFDLSQDILIKYQILDNGQAKWITSDKKFAPNTWFNVKYVVNTKAHTADFYYNDELVAADLPAINSSPFGGLVISTNNGTVGELWLDNFSMTVDQSAAKDSFISGKMEAGRLALSAYVSDEVPGAKAFVAYYSNETLTDVVVLDCTPGEELKRTLDIPEQNLSEIRLMLWSDMMPLCADVPVPLSQS